MIDPSTEDADGMVAQDMAMEALEKVAICPTCKRSDLRWGQLCPDCTPKRMRRKFDREWLLALLDGGEPDGAEIKVNDLNGKSRWSDHYEFVFFTPDDGKFWRCNYSVGATEGQDESPWQYAGTEILATEVEPCAISKIIYKEVV